MMSSIIKIASLLGGLSLNIALGMVYSMSNSSIYVASYMRSVAKQGSRPVTLADVSWVYTLNVFFLGLMLPLGGYINKRLGIRKSLYLASALFSVSTFLSCWSVSSYYWFLIIFGCIIGIADGIAFNIPQYCAYKHYPNNIGLASSVVISGLALSPILFSPLQTWIVNPENKMPDLKVGNALYFSDEEILMRVPKMFIAMGLFVTSLCIFSIFTMHEPKEETTHVLPLNLNNRTSKLDNLVPNSGKDVMVRISNMESSSLVEHYLNSEQGMKCDVLTCNNTNSESISTALTPTEELCSFDFDLDNIQLELKLELEKGEEENNKEKKNSNMHMNKEKDENEEKIFNYELNENLKLKGENLKPSENIELDMIFRLLKERQFWLVFWLLFLFSQYVHFIASWWKNIGIIHLNISDELLATIGTLITSGNNVFGRCFFGSWIDKFGGRICFIFISLSCLFSVVIFQLSLVLNSQTFYLICIGFIFFNMGAGFVLFPPIVAIYFGVEYYALVYGVIYIGRSLGVLFNSLLTSLLIGLVNVQSICLIIGIFTFLFFFLSTRFHDNTNFSDKTLYEKLFPLQQY
ncbi:transporter with signal peptide plus 12 transmembrane domain [Cryptosporidium sp. chipmunk genotype I]|uniref:transporter with signal peptide plus 12 transmembrane domain n=1 Tax=Cryptosporidium sp. chipmunk genotype I TaxID=1280935 RepID=UPI003519E483|nr:transporter with signal peptide plus 12 transmembrane domain [Cryptosporidium sp. chipmunk genotype I]